MSFQLKSSKLAEVDYRSKISQQHLGLKTIFENEPTSKDFYKILKGRLKKTEDDFRKIQSKSLALSPYLEIGAEYALAATLLENKFKASGLAVDISLHSLAKADIFAKKFNYKRTPKTVCADANLLPFKSDSFPFIFIYETLHHFPSPKPIIEEIYRVLAPGGICLIGADPIKPIFRIILWNRPTKLRLWEKILKISLLLPLISDIGKTEIEHGIIETAFTLETWQNALSVFDHVELTIKAFPCGPSQKLVKSNKINWLRPSALTKLALNIFGGGLKAFAYKKGPITKLESGTIENLFICPDCLKKYRKEYPLKYQKTRFQCEKCKTDFEKYHNVQIILEKNLREKILKSK